MFDVFFGKASALNERGQPFALAVVVRYEAPSSGKAGDKAIILEDGSIEGWIGGGCTQPVVIQEARKVLVEGKPRLIRIAPSTEDTTEGIVRYPMTCHSGGALDVYIEPVYPKPHLIVFGHSVVAQTLCRLARAIHYRVSAVAPEAEPQIEFDVDRVLRSWDIASIPFTDQTFVVVATQGEGDEQALKSALAYGASYTAFVASRKKAVAVFENLAAQGIDKEAQSSVKSPAGLDIGARLPEEIAVSILAEILKEKRHDNDPVDRIHGDVVSPATTLLDLEKKMSTMLNEHLEIEGMSCAHCVMTVEKALKSFEGLDIEAVTIGAADFKYDPEKVSKDAIKEAINDRGFEVVETD